MTGGPARPPDEPPDEILYHHKVRFSESIRTLWAHREIIYTLAERDFRAQYKQATLGVLWAVLSPVLTLAIFIVVFSRVKGLGTPGVPYPLYSFIGIAVTSASTVVFGEPIWNPIVLLGRFHQPLVAFLALISILIATLNVNIGANVVSPSNDFSNLAPRLISFRTGGLITGFLGLAMMPWKLMATFGSYIFGWLVGYSGLLGPVAAPC